MSSSNDLVQPDPGYGGPDAGEESTKCLLPAKERTGSVRKNSASGQSRNLTRGSQNLYSGNASGGKEKKNGVKICGATVRMTAGAIISVCSLLSFIFTPEDFLLWEKKNMRPGLPPFQWWANPPEKLIFFRIYVFNVTNHERFLSGQDAKLNIEEVGPIVYEERLIHTNIKFNDNDTMTYSVEHKAIYLPEYNTIDMNATVFLPNFAVLGIASYLYDASFMVKFGYKLLATTTNSPLIIQRTIYEYLWDLQDPVLHTARTIVPGLVPVANMGMMNMIYRDFKDNATVRVGQRWGDNKFFGMEQFNGDAHMPFYPASCPDEVTNSTEGILYNQRLDTREPLLYWRKTLCKLMPLYFDQLTVRDGIPTYRYNLSESTFDRTDNGTDCYKGSPALKNGLSDVSRCFFDFPIAASFPHFYTGDPTIGERITGLKPNKSLHNSFIYVEPKSGIPLHSVARSQCNLVIKDLSGFGGNFQLFSGMALPMFWGEYRQEELPSYIHSALYFGIVILPPLQITLSSIFLIIGVLMISKVIYLKKLQNSSLATMLPSRRDRLDNLAKNTILSYETESILRKFR